MESLRVINLGVEAGGRRILENVNLYIKEGQTFVLFGPNGSGKSSLLSAIVGHPNYRVVQGRITLRGEDITNLSTDERVRRGIGIAFQNPPKVSGVKLIDLLRKCANVAGLSEEEAEKRIDSCAKFVGMEDMLDRAVNDGFSGGEIKKSELLQLMVLDPEFVMPDEPDSGVDLENIAIVGRAIKKLLERDKKEEDRRKSGLVITHTGHILDYVDADYGVVLFNGRISCIGDPYKILEHITKYGYEACIRKCVEERR
jgi:Fe-S cluster assembly ATP-binding protein